MLIGFGAGSAGLETLVEGYVVTTRGLVPLGSAQIETSGGKKPGMLVPMGAGAAAGRAATSAAISGASNILQEAGPEGLDAAAKRTAKEIAREIVKAYEERGWL
jgi:NADPH-dependent 2,4-dienoyl-CoA reductase/sulfur reductase-like enzyme